MRHGSDYLLTGESCQHHGRVCGRRALLPVLAGTVLLSLGGMIGFELAHRRGCMQLPVQLESLPSMRDVDGLLHSERSAMNSNIRKIDELMHRIEHDAVHTRLDDIESMLRNHSVAQQQATHEHSILLREQGSLLRDQGRALDDIRQGVHNHSVAQQRAMHEHGTLLREQGSLLRDQGRALDDIRTGVHTLTEGCVCLHGVQLNVSLNTTLRGYTKYYDEPYSHATTSEEMARIPAGAGWVFLGARSPEGQIALGACGSRAAVLAETPWDEPRESNGVWWYFTKGRCMGFSDKRTIDQYDADVEDESDVYRLSWALNGVGGWRAGAHNRLRDSKEWHKLVYYC